MEKFDSYTTARGSMEFQNRCSSDKVSKLVAKLTPKQKEAVRKVGFGVFLDVKHVVVDISLISFLVNQVDTRNNNNSIYGKTFVLTKERFEEIIGVYDGREEILLEGEDEGSELVGALLGSSSHLVLSQLCSDLEEEKDAGQLFLVRFMLLIIGAILCPSSVVYLKSSYAVLLEDVAGIKKKN